MNEKIIEYIRSLPVISTHEHHLEDDDQSQLSLENLLSDYSYVAWLNVSTGESKSDHSSYLQKVRHNSYFVWLEKALLELYDVGEKITSENWELLSSRIKEKHKDTESHLQILRNNCRYIKGLADLYWNPGSDLNHRDLFLPVIRTDMFVKGFHPSVRDHDNMSPWIFFDMDGLSFGEYMDLFDAFHREKVKAGAVSFKLASAYERTLSVGDTSSSGDYDRAAGIFMKDPREVSKEDAVFYGDYIINRASRLSAELDVPYQIHTGLGSLPCSDPLKLLSLIERNPETKFVLFHGGFPWFHEIGALAHNYSNVFVDMVWLPLISTTAAISALNSYIEIVPSSDRIAWGSDTWTSEEALGSLRAWEHVLGTVLTEKIESGYLDYQEAQVLAEKFMYKNAQSLYKIKK